MRKTNELKYLIEYEIEILMHANKVKLIYLDENSVENIIDWYKVLTLLKKHNNKTIDYIYKDLISAEGEGIQMIKDCYEMKMQQKNILEQHMQDLEIEAKEKFNLNLND